MTSAAIWQIAFGVVFLIAMVAVAVGTRRTLSIGALLVLIPFQIIDTRYGSSSILLAYGLAAVLLVSRTAAASHAALALDDRACLFASFCTGGSQHANVFTPCICFSSSRASQFPACVQLCDFRREGAHGDGCASRDQHAGGHLLPPAAISGPGSGTFPSVDEFKFNLDRHPGIRAWSGPFDNAGGTARYFALMTLIMCAVDYLFAAGRRRF